MVLTDNTSLRILVVDSTPTGGQMLAGALAPHLAAQVAHNGEQALAELRERFDVAVLATMGDDQGQGAALLRRMVSQQNDLRCVALLEASQREPVLAAFRAGASGIFCRTDPIASLVKCVECVHGGQVWANTEQLNFVLDALTRTPQPASSSMADSTRLSQRETEVAQLVAEGLTNRQIAEQLHLSRHTVKNYVFRVFEKLGMSSRVELVLYALKHSRQADLPRAPSLSQPAANPLRRPRRPEGTE